MLKWRDWEAGLEAMPLSSRDWGVPHVGLLPGLLGGNFPCLSLGAGEGIVRLPVSNPRSVACLAL